MESPQYVQNHSAGASAGVSCLSDTGSEDESVVISANKMITTEYNNQPSTSANSDGAIVGKKKKATEENVISAKIKKQNHQPYCDFEDDIFRWLQRSKKQTTNKQIFDKVEEFANAYKKHFLPSLQWLKNFKERYNLEDKIDNTLYHDMELELYLWTKEQKRVTRRNSLSYGSLKRKAKELYENKYKLSNSAKKISSRWITDFKTKFNIPHRISWNLFDRAKHSHSHIIEKFMKTHRESKISSVEQVYSAATMNIVWNNKQKHEQLTFLACANQSGTHKLKLKIIGDVDIDDFDGNGTKNLVYYENKTNRLFLSKTNSFQKWFQRKFVPEVEESLQAKGLPKRALLLIQGHEYNSLEKYLVSLGGCIKTVVIHHLNPMSLDILPDIKNNVEKVFAEKQTSKSDSKQLTKEMIQLLIGAWDQVTELSIQLSWQKVFQIVPEANKDSPELIDDYDSCSSGDSLTNDSFSDDTCNTTSKVKEGNETSEEIYVKEENNTSEEITVKEEVDEHEEINGKEITDKEISIENNSIENIPDTIPEIKSEEEEIEIVDEFQLFLDSQNAIKEDQPLMSNSANVMGISEGISAEYELIMADRPPFNTATTLFVAKQEDLPGLTDLTTAAVKPVSFKDVLTCVDTSMRWAGENHVDEGILASLKDLREEVALKNYANAHNVSRMKD